MNIVSCFSMYYVPSQDENYKATINRNNINIVGKKRLLPSLGGELKIVDKEKPETRGGNFANSGPVLASDVENITLWLPG